MLDPSDRAPLGHDGYFKRWSLNDPEVPGSFILMDEAQDTNPAMLAALRNQDAQVVYIGDRYQQIYEWRGAVNAMERVATKHDCSLTQSFRFGTSIADAASLLLTSLGERQRLTGTPNVPSKLGCSNPDAILCRTNAAVIDYVIQAFAADITPHVIGGTSEALRLLDGVSRLKVGQPTNVPEFFGFQNWKEVVQFSESEEGQHLRTFVRLVERHGENKLRSYLTQVEEREDAASLVISTAHKAKGREWDNVCVVDDFTVVKKDDKGQEIGFDEEELRLLYVALTRGRLSVQIPTALASRFGIKQEYRPLRLDQLSSRRGAYRTRLKHRSSPQQPKQVAAQSSKYNSSDRPRRSEPVTKESALRRLLKKLIG
jgi:superfamily I DNA/RNA helicase